VADRLTVARPYAKAAFAQAKAGSALGSWSEALTRAAMAVSDDRMNRYAFVRSRAIAALVRLEDLVLLEQY
jgi:F0F1-type ATP synthase delta subunit